MVIVSCFLTISPSGKPQIKFWFIGGHLLTKHLLSSKHKINKSYDQICPFWCLATISRFHLRKKKIPKPHKIPEFIFVIIRDISFRYPQLDTGYLPRGWFSNPSVPECIPSMEIIHSQHWLWPLRRLQGTSGPLSSPAALWTLHCTVLSLCIC